nr:immunoglobulin light chain junction region [Macaca mulatta]MOW71965.1 immunoglobulin light chain junction region [Macaca mulatta]
DYYCTIWHISVWVF